MFHFPPIPQLLMRSVLSEFSTSNTHTHALTPTSYFFFFLFFPPSFCMLTFLFIHSFIHSFIRFPPLPQRESGLLLMRSVLSEFSTSSRSSVAGLTWESHFSAKHRFELSSLKPIFMLALQGLHGYSTVESMEALVAEVGLLELLLSAAEQVVQWQFTNYRAHRLLGTFEPVQHSLFKPPQSWADVLTPDVINLFVAVS